MDWLRQVAAQLREWLSQQAWLDGWQSSIAHTPDWALLATGPATLLLFALLLRITWPGSRTSDTDTKPQAQKQSRQQASANVAPPPATTKSPPTLAPARRPTAVQPAALRAPAQIVADDEDNRSVRVFVSSTFLDMQTERDELVTKTFPALRAKYRARGVELFEVDLRWGITREQQERGETLPTLLAEIDRCRPYFIGLLGDRYGWVPPSAALTDKLKADYPVLADAQGASVTAMEIMHGVLSNPDAAARACFFERAPNWDWRATLNDADRAAATAEPETARAKLADLKVGIGQKARVEAYARPEEIGPKVAAALDALLEARFPEADAPDAFEQTARLHRAYARDRRGLHVGADGYMRDLNRWMETKDAAPLLITGASGGGKSTLVANWLHAWRKAHPSDIVFEHYLGASPDSADPMLIMQRLWEHLNRTSGETVALPGDRAELMDVSAALAQRLAQARLSAERNGSRMLIALDGLDKLSSEQNLRWLPIASGVHWLASSLPSEAETAARARGFAPLDVKPLSEQERRDFIVGTLARWRRELEPQHVARILNPAAVELAGSPLYLKTVLEELRVSADNARLAERLEDYRGARDMANLFDRVLKRLEDDCEPDLAAKALPLIWASRAGLEETEILAITGAAPLAWATLRNGLGDGLRDSQGRLAFGHDYLNQAVAARYLNTDERMRAVRIALADRFEAREPDKRQAEELPYQLRAAAAWERLEALLVDLNRFDLLRSRSNGELLSYWLALKARGRDVESLLCAAFEARAGTPERWTQADIDLAFSIEGFLGFAGATGEASRRLSERKLAACERIHGLQHADTLASMGNLGTLLFSRGDYEGAQRLEEQALETRTRWQGPDNPSTFKSMGNLAGILHTRGDLEGAHKLYDRALEGQTRALGADDPETLRIANNMAGLLQDRGDRAGARALVERVLEARRRRLGPDHRDTLTSMNNLALMLTSLGDFDAAQKLQEEVLDTLTRLLGADHPDTLTSLGNLAFTHRGRGDFARAQELVEREIEGKSRVLGPEHPHTVGAMGMLAVTLKERGNFTGGRALQEKVLEVQCRTLGMDHPASLISKNNLALTLSTIGDFAGAQKLQDELLETRTRLLGKEHPDTLASANNLAQTLQYRGDLSGARKLYEEVIEARIRSIGKEHPDTLVNMSNLATVLTMQGDPKGARALLEEVLEIRTRRWGKDHTDTLTTMSNLGAALLAMGDLAGAQSLAEHVVDARTRLLGPDHPATISSMGALAATHSRRGDLESAQRLEEKVLDSQTRLLGPEHPSTLACMNNLGYTLFRRGDLARAEELQRRAVALSSRVLGPEHSATLNTLNNLAGTLQQRGDLEGAQALYERVIEASTRLLGSEHLHTLASMTSLAQVLRARRDFDGAKRLFDRVLEGQERALGSEHPTTLTTLHTIAGLATDRGDQQTAQTMFERVLETRERVLPPDHADTFRTMLELAVVYFSRGLLDRAQRLQERMVEVSSRLLGEDDPLSLARMNDLARTLYQRGEGKPAREMFERIFDARTRTLGPEHADTRQSANNLAVVLAQSGSEGDRARARTLLQYVLEANTRLLGPDHPHTKAVHATLASIGSASTSLE